jgi:hypothetical protein
VAARASSSRKVWKARENRLRLGMLIFMRGKKRKLVSE